MISTFLQKMQANGLSDDTVRAYGSDLKLFQQVLGHRLEQVPNLEEEAQKWLNFNRKIWSPATVVRRLATLRRYGAFLSIPNFLADYKPPRPADPTPHPIAEGITGVVRMIESSKNPRHRALCALNGLLGLRISECIQVTVKDIDLPNMELSVRGKGDKARIVPLTPGTWRYIEPAYRRAITNGGTLVRLTERGARASVTRHGVRARLENHVASHDLRATFLTAAYENSLDIRAVQELAGHSDPKTTQRYTKVSSSAKRSAAAVI